MKNIYTLNELKKLDKAWSDILCILNIRQHHNGTYFIKVTSKTKKFYWNHRDLWRRIKFISNLHECCCCSRMAQIIIVKLKYLVDVITSNGENDFFFQEISTNVFNVNKLDGCGYGCKREMLKIRIKYEGYDMLILIAI